MGWKCALQIKGLTLGEPQPGAKHRMNLRKATMEAGYERASKSDTLDRNRSHFNQYTGFRSGKKCADEMEAEAAFVTVTMKDGTVKQRKSRSDAVPGFAVICNPPAEICRSWNDATYQKFYRDSWECLSAFKPKIFRAENIVMNAEHYDEGIPPEDNQDINQIDRHVHWIGYARDENGKWCGNEIDAKFFVDLNKIFPQMMRDRGWEMDDLDTTDFDRAAVDKEYAAERRAKRNKSGQAVNKHLTQKARKMVEDASDLVVKATELHREADTKMQVAADLMFDANIEQQYADEIKNRAENEMHQLMAKKKALDQEIKEKLREVQERRISLEQREKAVKVREEQCQELIALGRKAKAAELGDALGLMSDEFISNGRRLPDIDF